MKYSFPEISTRGLKEEVVLLIFSKISNNLMKLGNERIDNSLNFWKEYRISIDKLIDYEMYLLIDSKLIEINESIAFSIIASLTRKYNEEFKIKR